MSVQVKGSGTIGGLDEGLVVSGIVTSSTQINVGSNIKIGTAGVVTATSFVGSGANLTSLPTQVTISSNADNRVITGGSGVNLNGEANLTFDGDSLLLLSSTNGRRVSFAGGGTSHYMKFDNTLNGIILNGYGGIAFETNGTNERLRIASNGKVSIGNLTSPDSLLHIHNGSAGSIAASSAANLTIESDGSYNVLQFLSPHTAEQQIRFGDNSDNGKGYIAYNHGSDYLGIGVGGPERLRISSAGNIGINETSPSNQLHIAGTTSTSAGGLLRLKATTGDNFILYDNTHDSTEWAVGNDSGTRGNYDIWYNNGSSYDLRFRIDSSGNVTKPRSCCFQAVVNGSHISAGSYVVFGSVDVNRGNDYNSSNGIFTAPVEGVYLFHISSIAFNNATTVFRFFLKINNGNTGSGSDAHLRLDMNNDDTDYAPNASYTYYKAMNANDTARVYFAPDDNSANAYGGSDYFKFGGHLIG